VRYPAGSSFSNWSQGDLTGKGAPVRFLRMAGWAWKPFACVTFVAVTKREPFEVEQSHLQLIEALRRDSYGAPLPKGRAPWLAEEEVAQIDGALPTDHAPQHAADRRTRTVRQVVCAKAIVSSTQDAGLPVCRARDRWMRTTRVARSLSLIVSYYETPVRLSGRGVAYSSPQISGRLIPRNR